MKTRLMVEIGAQGAADLHRALTEHCIQQITPAHHDAKEKLTIFYTGGSEQLMSAWFPGMPLVKQQGNTLGQRMLSAFRHTRQQGGQRILLIGSDCPDVNGLLLNKAFALLNNHDLVLGPTYDGGYYLIGINTNLTRGQLSDLLTDIPWGTGEVLQKTLAKAKDSHCTVGLLPSLHDIDLPEDLEHFNHHANS